MIKEKTKQKNRLFLTGIIFFSVFLSLFVFGKTAQAADYKGTCYVQNFLGSTDYKYWNNKSETECKEFCEENSYNDCYWDKDEISLYNKYIKMPSSAKKIGDFGCKFLETPGVCLLKPVHTLVRWIFLAASTLFAWIIKPDNINLVLNGNGVVFNMWAKVRDILNIAFIFVLLFSAFCTIFQVEKYNYKKILLMLVIMALLVNFSYPIARVIIDVSNVLMYSLLNSLQSTASVNDTFFQSSIMSSSKIDKLLTSTTYKDAGIMLTSIIFLFMFSITILAFAVLLTIRMIALAILVIFAPIGFVGNIMPGFESLASKWWENLFKYAFFGPIMALGLVISIEMMAMMSKIPSFNATANNIASKADPNIFGSIAFMSIPLILLWMTMGMAQSMSITGAGAVMGKAQGFLKKSGKWGVGKAGGNFLSKAYKAYGDERKKRDEILEKNRFRTRLGKNLGQKPGELRDYLQASSKLGTAEEGMGAWIRKKMGVDDARDRATDLRRKKVQEQLDVWKKQGGESEENLKKILRNGKKSTYERQAAAIELSKEHGFKGDDAYENYTKAREVAGNDKVIENNINNGVRRRRLDLIVSYDIANPGKKTSQEVAREKFEGFTNDDFKNIDFESLIEKNADDSVRTISKNTARNYFRENTGDRRREIFKRTNSKNQAYIERNILNSNENQQAPPFSTA